MTTNPGGAAHDGGRLGALITGYNGTQVTRVIAELAIPDHLADGPLSADDLASATGTKAAPLRRLLSAALVYGLVTADDHDRFALTSLGGLLRTDVPGSMRPMAVGFTIAPLWQAFGALGDVVRTGQSVAATVPGGLWEYFDSHSDDEVWFGRATSRFTTDLVAQIRAAGYAPPPDARRIVDVGGGIGTVLACLLDAAPSAHGVLFDRAEALAGAPAVVAAVADRVEFVEGDFFESAPDGDVHVLASVLHNWSDDKAREIVANCHQAARPGSSLIVIGLLLPPKPEPSLAYLMDLQMMVMMEGGRERTLAEHESLLAAEGYEFVRDVPIGEVMPAHVLEFRRR
ncbi:MAG TPA: methyltransferase [Pseudonocardiaceae bacterium]|jgi:SAM-dependent methyltransferase|nr:methyltransferase [Pseudonocardiaceae bacterium]